MNNKKAFYKQANFYAAACAFVFITIALCLYAAGCASEFNGGAVSSAVVAGDVIAIILVALAVGGGVVEHFLPDVPVLSQAVKYRRFCLYAAFAVMIYSFLSSILAEYSLIGTILYPIVSGTVGDPVDGTLTFCYFAQMAFTLVAAVGALVSSVMLKSASYKAEKTAAEAEEAR